MDQYFHRREQLIAVDRGLRVDHGGRAAQYDRLADDADSIVRTIRAEEALSIWGPDSNAAQHADDATHVFPGMGFLTGRDIILSTNLFKIVSKMPKGALLHAHLDATVNADVLLSLALKHPNIHIRTSTCLTPASLGTALPEFRPMAPAADALLPSITDVAYTSYSWIPLPRARREFPASLGGVAGFDEWFKNAVTITPAEAYRTHNTPIKIWSKFASVFKVTHPLVYYAPIWREYIRSFILSSIEDGIAYVEARINFLARFMIGEDGQENIPHREWLVVYDSVMQEIKDELKAQGREDDFIGSKIIYTTIRYISPEELEWYLDDCIALKQEFPHLICGFDLVGHEDVLKPLIDYIEPLTKFAKRVKDLGLDLPFIFHAGETIGDGEQADMNLYDAILLDTKRIGHGFSLIRHPKLMEICKQKNIAIEVCPISNEILRLTTSMLMHPLPALMNHGVPVSLCSDDPSVFGNMGLSFDFFQVLVASEVNGLKTIGELARLSFTYSCLDADEQKEALERWDKQWHAFLQWVVSEWGPKTDAAKPRRN